MRGLESDGVFVLRRFARWETKHGVEDSALVGVYCICLGVWEWDG